jgi:hypothetical protein
MVFIKGKKVCVVPLEPPDANEHVVDFDIFSRRKGTRPVWRSVMRGPAGSEKLPHYMNHTLASSRPYFEILSSAGTCSRNIYISFLIWFLVQNFIFFYK